MEPVQFSLLVNGKRIGAVLETVMEGTSYNIFSVRFADGYHDCFFDKGDGQISSINTMKGKVYAAALKHEIKVFSLLVKDTQLENFPYEVDGQFANGWILKKQLPTGLVYTIYLKGVYQFDIVEKEKGWTAVVSNIAGRTLIDTKLANHAFTWANTVVEKAKPVEAAEAAVESAKPVEFPLTVSFEGSNINAFGLLMDTRPWPQCTIGVSGLSGNPANIERFDFFKVNNPGQLFTWLHYPAKKEKMAQAIAKALEQKFSVEKTFAMN